jgi:hypothetical protein
MNVVDNLNYVQVINKPCMRSRCMSLLPRTTLYSDSKHVLHIGECSRKITIYLPANEELEEKGDCSRLIAKLAKIKFASMTP